jgi:hypothetical protein
MAGEADDLMTSSGFADDLMTSLGAPVLSAEELGVGLAAGFGAGFGIGVDAERPARDRALSATAGRVGACATGRATGVLATGDLTTVDLAEDRETPALAAGLAARDTTRGDLADAFLPAPELAATETVLGFALTTGFTTGFLLTFFATDCASGAWTFQSISHALRRPG